MTTFPYNVYNSTLGMTQHQKNILGERFDVKLTKGNSYMLTEDDILSFKPLNSDSLPPVEVDLEKFFLPEGTLEKITYNEQEGEFYSFCLAITALLYELISLTGCSLTKEEKKHTEKKAPDSPSTFMINEIIKTFVPMIISRLTLINDWSPRKAGYLNITQIGETRLLTNPWELPFSDPGLSIDMNFYISHTAKIGEDGMVTYTSVTEPDGLELFPSEISIPAFVESAPWVCVKP